MQFLFVLILLTIFIIMSKKILNDYKTTNQLFTPIKKKKMILDFHTAPLFGFIVFAIITVLPSGHTFAQSASATVASTAANINPGSGYVGAGLATGLASIGAGIGVGIAGAAGIGSVSEKPRMLGKSMIYAGLASGIATYGLIVSILIMNRI